ncbi:uncharacterized protein LOC123266021 [Cotesia glomerata]|uniref:uncharacterized protein LOC123266021 n=1 Tax=Cotesia glomerata TaxID=32391 RepID=UPI001D012BD6|nr:uncharacterized protein LOC123266021 [Cotesia glomerata]
MRGVRRSSKVLERVTSRSPKKEASINHRVSSTKFTPDKTFNTVDDNLGTFYKRKKFCEKNFPYVSPIQIPVNNSSSKKKQFFHYVPLKETIKQLYDNKSLSHNLVFDIPKYNSKILKDFTDGSVFKNNPFFKDNPNAVQLILYQDSFEIVNPIGSAKSKYKILAVYFSKGNYPDKIRSHVNSMYLVALCKEKLFDHTKVFGKVIQDIKDIETDAIEISPGKVVKGSLVFVTGDNLGSRGLGRFAENFSKTQYFCRYCLVTKKSFETTNGVFKNNPIRTVESYKIVITKLNRKKSTCSQKKANKKPLLIQGIKFDCVFNQLNYHVRLSGLPPCLGHDIFEDVLAYDLKLYLDDLVDKGWFSYKLLNHRIEIFDYSVEDQRDK